MSAMKNLCDAFCHELMDAYSAEKQRLEILPKMAAKANCEKLTEAFEEQQEACERHVRQIEQAFESIDKTPKAKKCEAMAGLIKETTSMMNEDADCDVKDAVLIAMAQKLNHYEIATFGTLCTWAEKLEYTEAKRLLGEVLDDEEKRDKKFTEMSKCVNAEAVA